MNGQNQNPAPPPQPPDFYGIFSGAIDQASLQKFFNNFAVVTQQPQPNKHLHLLVQSTGGTIADGTAMYNFLKAAPIDVFVYNSGCVQSMATVCFLAAKRRVVSRHATFMLHRASCAPQAMTMSRLADVLKSLEIDDGRMDAILKSHLKLSDEQWAHLRNNEFWFTADDALKSGLATEIGDFSPPKGAKILSFNL
ncbi:MAG TPA: ATP-dependent Clp protease proteolytic subunit [Methylomirabilota bacterium]|nr:ATP-dependent Clp protease proteolytic subunit [Methylomirabilota bacterium]